MCISISPGLQLVSVSRSGRAIEIAVLYQTCFLEFVWWGEEMHGMLSINELMFQIDFEYTMPKYGSVPNICLSVRNFKLFFPYIEHFGWGEGSMEFI